MTLATRWILCALLGAAPAVGAQPLATALLDGPPGAELLEPTARATPCVIHLVTGSILRAPTVRVEGGFRVGNTDMSVFLRDDAVLRIAPLAGLSAELRVHDRRHGPAKAAAHALDAGLLPEALERLDRALSKDPTDRLALELIANRSPELPIATPGLVALRKGTNSHVDAAAIEPILREAARLGPAAREIVARELGLRVDAHTLGPVARGELDAADGARRSFGALLHARALPGRNLGPLLRQSLLDPSAAARTAGAQALGASADERVLGSLVRAFESEHAVLSLRAAQALGHRAEPEVLSILMGALQSGSGGGYRAPRAHIFVGRQHAYVQDFDVQVAQGSSIADPVINTLVEGAVLDVGVQSVTAAGGSRIQVLRRAVQQITGADPGATHRQREKWWTERRAASAANGGPSTP